MIRTLFLVLWIIIGLGGPHAWAIEIYVNGHKYDSMKAYLASKKTPIAQAAITPETLDSQQEDYIRQEAQKLGIDVDFGKVKTFQVNRKKLSDKDVHKLYVLSVENGVVGALQEFYQTRGKSDFHIARSISSDHLQEAIAQAVTTSKDPKLLISEPGKVRIMALTTDNSEN